MNFDINSRTIFLTLTGSRVYGTATPESDYDHRGVAVPPIRYFFGYKSRFDQYEDKINDTVVYDIRKFLKLAADNNPNILELLYIPDKYWKVTSSWWETIVEHRDLFLSQKAYSTHRGYAHSQLKRLQTHRGWLMQGELVEPTREAFGLPPAGSDNSGQVGAGLEIVNRFLSTTDVEHALAEVAKLGAKSEAIDLRQNIWDFLERTLDLSRPEIEDVVHNNAMHRLGMDSNLVDRLQKEKAYASARQHYNSWLRWKKERNLQRKKLEEKCQYDAKHASHLVRLLSMCAEILDKCTMSVERPDAGRLRDIRNGEWEYDRLMDWVDKKETALEEAKKETKLRHSPDRNRIEELGMLLTEDYLRNNPV